MKQLIRKTVKSLKSVRGNSLAEFATTTALMATLAATAAPKLSELSEGTKSEKSRNEIDKIIKIAGNFYQDTADNEGRGRFPNQAKFNVSIGGGPQVNYSNGGTIGQPYDLNSDTDASLEHQNAIFEDLGLGTSDGWNRFDENHANTWQSVFGLITDEDQRLVGGVLDAENYNESTQEDHANEWDHLFSDEILTSSFQDGHYVYTVIAGGGTGTEVYPPQIFVADVESVRDFNNLLAP
tara:strand:- start:4388 stop:5101 length:714 start_codon:yes stop_codon:yes gene_type:complete